ncbi:MAG: hypothetical protein K2I62_01820 [Alistipes sp.]|nr:hypothetical protein [Alistipes sp.]MDE5691461.1 hypothetical protein [Alistipes sp.]MDE6507485.1 hypothetical protein [Alistipes sp.]MDE7077367.1 hypothetical protein [Alistipes sp.]MDE7344237.1 hypothetical protein [Alistipes sp.]
MKNIKWLWIVLAAACLTACGGDSDDPGKQPGSEDGTVAGQWHMVSWSTLTAADIYVSFDEDGTFELYQRLTKPTFEHFSGSYSYAGGTLSGVYSDDAAWGNSYRVSFQAGGSQMTLTGVSGTADVALFVRTTIPEEILSGELEASAVPVRSDALRFL